MSFKNWLTKADVIKEHCQPFLKMTDQPLYRGVSIPLTSTFIRAKVETVRKDRKPRDSSLFSHKLADDWFFQQFKLRPRSQGLFCTASAKGAANYGKLAYVFPVGNFRYMWATSPISEPVHDSLMYMNDIKHAMRVSNEEDAEYVTHEILEQYTFNVNKGLEDAQDSNAEIILFCDEVILIPVARISDYLKFKQSLEA